MKKFLLSTLLLLLFAGESLYAQVTIMLEDFEDATVEYSTSVAEFTDGSEDYFIRTDGSDIGGGVSFLNIQGSSFFGAQDLDGDVATFPERTSPQTITFNDIDITGYSSIQLRVYLAEDDDGAANDWDSSDYVHITADIDDGSTQNLIWIENDGETFNSAPFIDTDFDGTGDGTEITDTFVQFTANITGTGDLLDLSIEIALNSGDEDIAIDNVEIIGTNSNSISLTSAAGYRLLSAATDISYSTLLDAIWTQGATGADATTGAPNVFEWDNTASGDANTNWTGQTDLSNTIVGGEGFLVYVYADDDFDGNDDSFPKTLTLNTGTAHAEGTSPTINANGEGWTLLGNPFNETIDFDLLTDNDINDVMYIWDPNSSSWETWNGLTGDITDGLIAVSQGFLVQTVTSPTSPSVAFPAGAKSSGGSFLGKEVQPDPFVRVSIAGDGVQSSSYLQFGSEGSLEERSPGDAYELQPLSAGYVQVAFPKSGELYDIANIGIPEEEVTVPLHVEASMGGKYTLTATDFVGVSEFSIVFHDYELGASIEVDETFAYELDLPPLKVQQVPPLTALKADVLVAKTSDDTRFGLTITPKSTSVNNEEETEPTSFRLHQNYPNPFNPSTTITYSLDKAGAVNISVFNLMGQKVAELVNETKSAGSYNVIWDAANAASGMYYYRLEANGQSLTRKMTLTK